MTDMGKPQSVASDPRSDPARVSLLGHDLRAAVSDVIGGLRLIDHTTLGPQISLQLERVRAAGEVLARLLEQELALLNDEATFPNIQPENVHITRLLQDLKARWSGRALEKGLSFDMDVGATVPQVVKFDRTALDRALSNILSNAIKYTDQGAIRFSITRMDDDSLLFVVEDEGPGFSHTALQSLFTLGERVDGHGKPGLGLGLRISREMTDRLGGEIWVENRVDPATSAPRSGARISIKLPGDAWEPLQGDRIANGKLPDLSKVRVLLADDSPTNQAVIGAMLSAMGAEYEVAGDGVEAMNLLDQQRFDLVLLDIEMPRLSGLEVLRLVRGQTGLSAQIPMLAITAYVLRANREAIYVAGADGILAKPVMCIESFGLAIRRALNRNLQAFPETQPTESDRTGSDKAGPEKSGPEKLGPDNSGPDNSGPDKSGPDLDRQRFDHLITIAGPVAARELLSRLETDLRQVERGLVAAFAGPNLAEIRGQTHVLIALAGAVGATPLQNLAETLNECAHQADVKRLSGLSAAALTKLDSLIHFISNELAQRQHTT